MNIVFALLCGVYAVVVYELGFRSGVRKAKKGPGLQRCDCDEPNDRDVVHICTNCGGYAP
jgi:hypothetical protein